MARRTEKGFPIDLRPFIERVGLGEVLRQAGLERVAKEVGVKAVIDELGVDALAAELTPKQRRELLRILQQGA